MPKSLITINNISKLVFSLCLIPVVGACTVQSEINRNSQHSTQQERLKNQEYSMSNDSQEIQDKVAKAASYRSIESLTNLLRDGASPNVMVGSRSNSSGSGLLLLELIRRSSGQAIDDPDRLDERKVIELLLEYGADINARDGSGAGVFHLAANSYRVELLDLLIKAGADSQMKDEKGRTAMFNADSLDMLKALEESGIGSLDDRDQWGNSLLHTATHNFMFKGDAFDYLIDKIGVNVVNHEGKSVIWELLNSRDPMVDVEENALYLIKNEISLDYVDADKQNLLILALRRGDLSGELIEAIVSKRANKFFKKKYIDVNHRDASGKTAIHYANANTQYLKVLIEYGADKNDITENLGRSPLMQAVLAEDEASVVYLLEKSVEVNLADKKGHTALNHAIEKENQGLIRLLKSHQASSNSAEHIAEAIKVYEVEQERPKSLVDAIVAKDIDLVEKFYLEEQDADSLDIAEAAFEAVASGYLEGFTFLESKGLNLDVLDSEYNLLQEAVFRDQVQMAEYLLDKGFDVNFSTETEHDTVYMMSASSSPEMYKMLLERGMKFHEEYDVEVVERAVDNENYNMARLFIEEGRRFDQEKYFAPDYLEGTVLWTQNAELLDLLIEQGLDINIKFMALVTYGNLLSNSVMRNAEDFFEALLERGADVEALVEGESLLSIAIQHGRMGMVKSLLDRFPDIELNSMGSERFVKERTALAHALNYKREDMSLMLLEHELDLKKLDVFDRSVLHLAADEGFTSVVRLLVERGLDTDSADTWGNTPLIYAINNGSKEMTDLLLPKTQNINTVNTSTGNTALHFAASQGALGTVKTLVERGVDVSILNNEKHTAMESAKENGHEKVYEYLDDKMKSQAL